MRHAADASIDAILASGSSPRSSRCGWPALGGRKPGLRAFTGRQCKVVAYGIPFPTKGIEALELGEERSEALFDRLKRKVVSSGWKQVRYDVLRGRPVGDIILRAARMGCRTLCIS